MFGVQQARQAARSQAGGGGNSSGGSFGRGRGAGRGGGGGGGGLKPAFGGSGLSGGTTGGRGFGRGGGWHDPHREDTWEALLVLAAVADAFDDTGPAKAWEVLQAAERGSSGNSLKGVVLMRQEKTEVYAKLRQQLQVGGWGVGAAARQEGSLWVAGWHEEACCEACTSLGAYAA